mmetsp:Transcript_13815/g.25621  ORF Transcript_13815/g.25621 Transcript_13815/m.25621 type:complete len:470 (-) Transcript_13815:59-1468(-)
MEVVPVGAPGGPRPSLGRRLSAVSEGIAISRRLYLTFIGPGAYACCESLVDSATKVFGALQQQRDSFRAVNSRPSCGGSDFTRVQSVHSRVSATSMQQPEFGSHSAIVVIDLKGGPQPLPGYGHAQKRSTLMSMSHVTSMESVLDRITASRNSYMSASTLHSSEADEEEEEQTRQCVKMLFHPVEYFSQEMPSCHTLDQWRHFCILFLIDPRLEGLEAKELLSDLERRLTEADKLISKFVKKFEVARALPLLGVILLHDVSATSAEEPALNNGTSSMSSSSSVSGFDLLSDDATQQAPSYSPADPDLEAHTEPSSPTDVVRSPHRPLRDGGIGCKDDCEACSPIIRNKGSLVSFDELTSSRSSDSKCPNWKPPLPARDFSSAAAGAPPLPERFLKFLARMRKITRAKEGEPTHFTCNFDDEEELLQCLLQITSTAESLRKNDAHNLYEPEMSLEPTQFLKPKSWRCELM